jgi:hypothetical protein
MQNTLGHMPIMVFANALLMGGNRVLLKGGAAFLHGPLLPCHLHLPLEGKIMYPQSKKGVFAPCGWSPALAERSNRLPQKRLQLSYVFGYEGKAATSPNMFFNAAAEVVYCVAAVAIVYDRDTHAQRFFLGHNDDIMCLGMHPDLTIVASGQARATCLYALHHSNGASAW